MVICDQTGTACQHGNDCLLRGVCRLIPNHGLGNLIASQPYSTNQEPAAPSLELARERMRQAWEAWDIARAEVESMEAEIDAAKKG